MTPDIIAQELQFAKTQLALCVNILKDVVFDIQNENDFVTKYKADIEKIQAAIKEDPRILQRPGSLPEIPQISKQLFSVISLIQPLLPQDPNKPIIIS